MYIVDNYYNILRKWSRRDSISYKYFYKVLKVLLNILFPVFYKKRIPLVGDESEEEVIVSFTTFPARIDTVWVTAYTLLNQTRRASHTILWLASSQFNSKSELPSSLLRLEKYGLEIKFCDDLRSHKKYYYVMKEYPNAVIVTADDDVFYPSNWLEELMKKHIAHPGTVICYWAHRIAVNNGKIEPYDKWYSCVNNGNIVPSDQLMPVGYGGVLYPAHSLDERLFDKKLIRELCITADDLWLKAMAYLRGVKAIQVEEAPLRFFSVIKAQDVSLSDVNNGKNMNNEALRNILLEIPELNSFNNNSIKG